ncbi:uncharacterized protein LOC119324655 isoform X2 [Triticum dicoccoides]|uniref:uncharacterized protein LOC119324655 isoform X2 n=1 Tax=Triticum dicoccoides TaxID=85692 RepID=UPI0018910D85|nr:uncharacterized protein LOC119324655 isoform X2 [Triticum dicoccoides]XP_044415089.1 uncharacterized protein LOC123139347 isoform X2 [Triticum aestivum]
MDRDVERGNEEGSESFYDCVLEIEEFDDPQHFPQETAVVQDPQHPTVGGETHALPGLMGNDLKSTSQIFSVVAATVGVGLLLAFLGLAVTPTASLMHSASMSSCSATTDDVARLYARVGVGLAIAVTQFLASLVGASGKEETAEPRVPVMRRVCVFVAALSQLGLTVSVSWSLILAVSPRLGQMRCWPQVTRDLLLTGLDGHFLRLERVPCLHRLGLCVWDRLMMVGYMVTLLLKYYPSNSNIMHCTPSVQKSLSQADTQMDVSSTNLVIDTSI